MTTGAWILLAAVLLAAAFGGWRALTNGRFRGRAPVREAARPAADEGPIRPASPLDAVVGPGQRGERATLVQFSSAFCAPCRVTRQVLADVAESVPGVTHVELDAESQLELVRALGISRTPTTLVLDGSGVEVSRAGGAPRKEQVWAALDAAIVHDVDGTSAC